MIQAIKAIYNRNFLSRKIHLVDSTLVPVVPIRHKAYIKHVAEQAYGSIADRNSRSDKRIAQ